MQAGSLRGDGGTNGGEEFPASAASVVSARFHEGHRQIGTSGSRAKPCREDRTVVELRGDPPRCSMRIPQPG